MFDQSDPLGTGIGSPDPSHMVASIPCREEVGPAAESSITQGQNSQTDLAIDKAAVRQGPTLASNCRITHRKTGVERLDPRDKGH